MNLFQFLSILHLFEDENGVMNISALDINADIMVVSQFTLYASCKKGNRPSYIKAAGHDIAVPLYENFCAEIQKQCLGQFATGEFGASIAKAIRSAKKVKAVLVYPKGTMRGLKDSDLIENGGNICAIEVDGSEEDCYKIIRQVFNNRPLVEKYGLTVANTANIGRLFPQTFFYPYAFSRIKSEVCSDIYYSLAAGNYSNVVAGLYSWKYSLPVKGFIVPANDALTTDVQGDCTMLDSMIPILEREKANPADPSNLERLENVFSQWSLLMKSLIFPSHVSEEDREAC